MQWNNASATTDRNTGYNTSNVSGDNKMMSVRNQKKQNIK